MKTRPTFQSKVFGHAWLILVGLALTTIVSGAKAQTNTATGTGALGSVTTGTYNTADGYQALNHDTKGSRNTAVGSQSLFSSTTESYNTATGYHSLYSTGSLGSNAAIGASALENSGYRSVANGWLALQGTANTHGSYNIAFGHLALKGNTGGSFNGAGSFNIGIGNAALYRNGNGRYNIGLGGFALFYTGGTDAVNNIALGFGAGGNGGKSNNIDIGNAHPCDMEGFPYTCDPRDRPPYTSTDVGGESDTIRIGVPGIHTATYIGGIYGLTASGAAAVFINSNGQLGTMTSSRRFKEDINSMDKASAAVLSLQPVVFRYKPAIDAQAIPQFGLVAEEVEKVNPDLVVRDQTGQPYSVRYEAVNAMLLNEFLKEHRKVEDQEATIAQIKLAVAEQETTIAEQQKEFAAIVARRQDQINALTASLKEQASQITQVKSSALIRSPREAAK